MNQTQGQEEHKMRKRILATIAAGSAAVLMLSGFDSAMTVEQLTENSKNAMAQMTSMTQKAPGRNRMKTKIRMKMKMK